MANQHAAQLAMPVKLTLLFACATLATAAHAQLTPAQPEQDSIALTEALIIAPVGQYGRAPLHLDAIEAAMLDGTWQPPTDGATMHSVDGTERTWKLMQADENGWFNERELRGGYAFWNVTQPHDTIMILTAQGPSATNVNGEWRVGDVYQTGWSQIPIALKEGDNALLFHVARGGLRASLHPAAGPIEFNKSEITMPTLVADEAFDTLGAVILINATNHWQHGLTIAAECEALAMHTKREVPAMPPCSIRKVPFVIQGDAPSGPNSQTITLTVADADAQTLASTEVPIRIVTTNDVIVRTFQSEIDGSVQYYGLRRAKQSSDDEHNDPGLILSLHGASVEAAHQASCYSAKPWAHIITPTNRRPFGFDWEDWGRLDALEVLDRAINALHVDPHRVAVTGHSMGGHGSWHMATTFPDKFVATAPSAGWVSFWSYAGASEFENASAIEKLLKRATTSSQTLELLRNLTGLGVYVLHGDIDDNVPVEQARIMRSELAKFHPDFAYHEQPGASHWWGNQCMDWPALMAFIHERVNTSTATPMKLTFTTADLGISATRDWITIGKPAEQHSFSTITVEFDDDLGAIVGSTANIDKLGINTALLPKPVQVIHLDEGALSLTESQASPGGGMIWLERQPEGAETNWALCDAPAANEKNPKRAGPFKDAFRHTMLFVVGTQGSEEENAAMLMKARYDAETFWYRGNGSIDIMLDTEFVRTAQSDHDRNVILYGNADTNAAWSLLLERSPVQVRRGVIEFGEKKVEGDDIACIMIRPRLGSDFASVGVIAGTSNKGFAAANRLPVFVSGVAYPDLMIWTTDALTSGTDAIECTGYFGCDWSIETGEFAWKTD